MSVSAPIVSRNGTLIGVIRMVTSLSRADIQVVKIVAAALAVGATIVLLVYFSNDAWLAMLAISTLTVLPAYLMTTAYLFKLCISGEYASYTTNHSRSAALVSSIIGFVFCLFMFYASEIKYLAMVPVLLTLFIWARKKDDRADKIFTLRELAFFILLLVLDIIVFILLHYKTIHF